MDIRIERKKKSLGKAKDTAQANILELLSVLIILIILTFPVPSGLAHKPEWWFFLGPLIIQGCVKI